MTLKRTLSAYGFLAFPLAILLIFVLGPTIAGMGLSLFQWDGSLDLADRSTWPTFVGLEHFRALGSDPKFWPAFWNTIVYGIVSAPPAVGLAFLLAVVLNARWFRGKALMRTLFFMPTIISIVAIGFVWRWLLDDDAGLLNWALGLVGFHDTPRWLSDGHWPMFWIIVISIWQKVGFCLVLYLAALSQVNENLYEAAEVDGASRLAVLRHITWPQVAPMTAFLMITGVISALMVFDLVYVVTGSSGSDINATDATNVLNLYIYQQFARGQLGYASAIGVVIFALTALATAAQLGFFTRGSAAGDAS